MTKVISAAGAFAVTAFLSWIPAYAVDDTPIQTTVSVNAAQTLRQMNPRRIGGTNVAMWNEKTTFASPEVRKWMAELHTAYIRIPGGSWANWVYWNGNGVRGADGLVDPSKVGPDGYPAVDYSSYAPSFTVDPKTLHPNSNNWHGNVDVKTLHEFVKAISGAEPMPCLNAGTGRPIDAAEWVKWANKSGYNARYWEIGNELEGSWEPGYYLPNDKGIITAEMYTKRYNDIATAMRKVDPTIKIGGLTFAEPMIRDCGDNVDFVSIHTYPGSATANEAQLFADIGKTLDREVGQVRGWIRKYQPEREKQIELSYTEWNLGGGVSSSELFSGLWASVFLGEMASHGVDFATHWDSFTHSRPGPDGHALMFVDGTKHTRKAQYYALQLWNNYMGDRLIPIKSSNQSVYSYASRTNDAVTVMLVNTDREREAKVNLQLAGFNAANIGEKATISSREYYWNPLTHLPQWSTGARIERFQTSANSAVTLPPFSITYVRVPSRAKPALSTMAQKALAQKATPQARPELRFVIPDEMYIGDSLRGDIMVLAAGTDQPYAGTLATARLIASGGAELDRTNVRLSESLGHFSVKATSAGQLVITAQSGMVRATKTITVKPAIPRPVVFWDFSAPRATDKESFVSDFTLAEDLTQRANRAVARVDLPAGGVLPTEGQKNSLLLQIQRFPQSDRLKKENIRGVVFDLKTSPDFATDDPNARIGVVMQSPADWWMELGDIPLQGSKDWQTKQVEVALEKHIKAMPSASNLWFILKADKPVKGSIYFDHIGFLVR